MNAPACEPRSGCITCGDVGTPMWVVQERDGLALCVDERGEHHEVAVDLIEGAMAGDRILVHAGVAIGAME